MYLTNDEYGRGVCDHNRVYRHTYFYILALKYNYNIFKNKDAYEIFIYSPLKYIRISI